MTQTNENQRMVSEYASGLIRKGQGQSRLRNLLLEGAVSIFDQTVDAAYCEARRHRVRCYHTCK